MISFAKKQLTKKKISKTPTLVISTAYFVHSTSIDCLHHKSWIVQISKLKEHRRDDLEKLLSIFDQNNITDSNHILNVNEDDFPEEFKHIIRRLKQAAESKEVAEQMIAEDELISDFQSLERQVGAMSEIIEKNAKALEDKDKIIEELRRKMGNWRDG